MIQIPRRLSRTVVELHGPAGVTWLQRLPLLVAECERRWSLTVLRPFPNLTYNYVAPATDRSGTSLVLKLGFPNPELDGEIEALRAFDGRGAVRLFRDEPEQGILLLERLDPGMPLSSLVDDAQATSIAVQVMRQLWRPAPAGHEYPTVDKWLAGLKKLRQGYQGTTGPLPEVIVEEAETLATELLQSMAEPALLHGDLHHDNILSAQRQPWLAVDPKGVIGEPAYEVGALLRNPPQLMSDPQAPWILQRRLTQLADELGFERLRLRHWGLVQAVLSAWWSLEDHGYGWEADIACAQALATIK